MVGGKTKMLYAKAVVSLQRDPLQRCDRIARHRREIMAALVRPLSRSFQNRDTAILQAAAYERRFTAVYRVCVFTLLPVYLSRAWAAWSEIKKL